MIPESRVCPRKVLNRREWFLSSDDAIFPHSALHFPESAAEPSGGFLVGWRSSLFHCDLRRSRDFVTQTHTHTNTEKTLADQTQTSPMGGLKLLCRLRARLKRRPQSVLDVAETDHGFAIDRVRLMLSCTFVFNGQGVLWLWSCKDR